MLSFPPWSVASIAALVAVSGATPVTNSPEAGSTTADAFPPARSKPRLCPLVLSLLFLNLGVQFEPGEAYQ